MFTPRSPMDHRHPNLLQIAEGIKQAARWVHVLTAEPEVEVLSTLLEPLYAHDEGDHADHVIAAAWGAWGVNVTRFFSSEAPDVAGSVKQSLINSPGDLAWSTICDAVVRLETCHHVPLVLKFTSNFVEGSDPNVLNRSSDELFSYGYIGLSNALRGYDVTTGNTIATFAAIRIVGAIRDGVRAESPVPKRLTTFVRLVARLEEELSYNLGRPATEEEVREALGPDARYYHLLPRLRHQASLEEMEHFSLAAIEDVERVAERHEVQASMQAAIGELNDLEREAIYRIHVSGETVRVASRGMGLRQAEFTAHLESAVERLKSDTRVNLLKKTYISI